MFLPCNTGDHFKSWRAKGEQLACMLATEGIGRKQTFDSISQLVVQPGSLPNSESNLIYEKAL